MPAPTYPATALSHVQAMAGVHDSLVLPFLQSVQYRRMQDLSPDQRTQAFNPGTAEHDRLHEFISKVDARNAASVLNLVVSHAPFLPIAGPLLDAVSHMLDEVRFASACLVGLGSVMSEWGAGSSPAGDDSIHLADMLYTHAGRMPKASATALAQIAWIHRRRDPPAEKLVALEWIVDHLVANPSSPDRGRNIWHELIASAVALTSKGSIDGDFASIDDLPLHLIERLSLRHGPADPLTDDPDAPARKILPAPAPADGDMVALLVGHCGSDIGLRKALSLQQSRQMGTRTLPAKGTGSSGVRM